ncbi:MAG: MurT ligase domain-containing protein [Oscillospiraceae bacterium]|nr:MurT ligase domain-containing protein [Oscillospiraceae bacterium]
MSIRLSLAVTACKILSKTAHILKKAGTAMPGRFALRIAPDMLSRLSKGMEIVVITGTNGKTSACRMMEECFLAAGKEPLTNKSGANLLKGIATDFGLDATLLGRAKSSCAVIECDEAACKTVLPMLKPKALLVTNIFEDQTDRFGDMYKTAEFIREGILGSPETIVCLNADDPVSRLIAEGIPNRVLNFGFGERAASFGGEKPAPELYCRKCGARYNYDYVSYGTLGSFSCPSCGDRSPERVSEVKEIFSLSDSGSEVCLSLGGDERKAHINLPAVYNIYNAAGVACAAMAVGIENSLIVKALGSFKGSFGRMEKLPLGEKGALMCLVKNATGFDRVLDYLSSAADELPEGERLTLCFLLNDKPGDGRDVSWIWDTALEAFGAKSDKIEKIYFSGLRPYDLALRFKYAGFPMEKTEVQKDYDALCSELEQCRTSLFLIPTYSGMMDFRSVIASHCNIAEYWEG